jgi:L-rhamnose mutarotase
MQLKPGNEAEYKRRHDEIWPELAAALTAAGVSDYAIYLDEETLVLFGVLKLTDDNTFANVPNLPIVRRWWEYMAPLMDTNADHSPVAVTLPEVFYLA